VIGRVGWRRTRFLLRWGMRPDDIPAYGFDRGRPEQDAEGLLGYHTYREEVRPALNDRRCHALTENKWIFYRVADAFGIPVPETFGLYDPWHGAAADGRPLRTIDDVLALLAELRLDSVVIKPAGGQRGRRVLILEELDAVAGTAYHRPTGRVGLVGLLRSLETEGLPRYPGYVIQERVSQHRFFEEVNPHTMNSLRIITIVDAHGEVRPLSTFARVGREGSEFEYWGDGGVAIEIDPLQGTMGRGVLKPAYGNPPLDAHPDTGVVFRGVRVPHWQQALAVCLRAGRLFPLVRTIGWDVVVTPDGPVVLEANADWGLQLPQTVSGGLFTKREFREVLDEVGIAPPGDRRLLEGAVRRGARHLARHLGR
jgi:hypothetical protein